MGWLSPKVGEIPLFTQGLSLSQSTQLLLTTRPLCYCTEEFTLKYWKPSRETEMGHLQSTDSARIVTSFHASYGFIMWFLMFFPCEITVRGKLICGSPTVIEEHSISSIGGRPKHRSMCNYRGCTYRVTTGWHFKSDNIDSASNTEDNLLPQKLLIATVFILERICIALAISVLLRQNNFCMLTWKLNSVS